MVTRAVFLDRDGVISANVQRDGRPVAPTSMADFRILPGVEEALRAGVGRLLLDNFTPERVVEAARLIAGRARIEVSGGLMPGKLRAYAEAGADFLSIGRLTHSAPAVDIALDMEPAR